MAEDLEVHLSLWFTAVVGIAIVLASLAFRADKFASEYKARRAASSCASKGMKAYDPGRLSRDQCNIVDGTIEAMPEGDAKR